MELINQTIGKYRVLRLIGQGGMASVYEAEHEMLGNKVAIKVLNPILSANFQIRERFKKEAKLMASLDHPNITKVIDFDELPEKLSIIMELLNGEDLHQKIKKNGPINQTEAVEIFHQALSALQYAHEMGIVHRDIKPSNIYILANGQVKILDFGIAKLFGQGNEMTQTGMQVGTPIYMSPEQVKSDKSIDYRSDIYSLGVSLYYTLNGKPPYDSDTASQFDIFNKIVFEELPELTPKNEFSEVIRKACQKDRELRYQSCDDFFIHLKNIHSSNQHTSGTNLEIKSSISEVEFEKKPEVKNKKRILIAFSFLALILLSAFGLNVYHKNLIEKGIFYFKEKNYKEAYSHFSNSSIQDNDEVQYYLGRMYSDGLYFSQNDSIAFLWFEKSANQNNAKGINALGLCYNHGSGVQKNLDKAFSLYSEAASKGSYKAFFNLGLYYLNGEGGSVDYKSALDAFNRSLFDDEIMGNGDAQYFIGLMYRDGLGVEKNLSNAYDWFLKGSNQNNAECMNNLGYFYLNGYSVEIDLKKAFEYFKSSADLGNALGLANVGISYLYGNGCNKDEFKAFEYLKKSADQLEPKGLAFLGLMYEYNLGGAEYDKQKAIMYYKQAADLGDDFAKKMLDNQ